jgi:hypothetical protein
MRRRSMGGGASLETKPLTILTMATTRRIAKKATAADEEDAPIDSAEAQGDGYEDLDIVLEELAGEAEYVVLWRLDGPNGKQEHVDKVQMSRFSAEYVTEKHGGGDYIMRAYGSKAKGGTRPVKKYKEFSINKSIPPKSGSAAIEWKKANGQALPSVMPSAPAERSPWIDVALAAVPGIATALVGVLTREKQTDPILLALLNKLGTPSENGNSLDPIALQRLLADERERALALGKEIGERRGGGEDDGVARVMESTLPGIVDVFKESVANDRAKVQAMRVHQRRVAPTNGNGGGAPVVPATTTGPEWLKTLRVYIPQLIAAQSVMSATDLAARVLDELPVRIARELSASCESETFVQDTLAELPELSKSAERHAYFSAVLAAVQNDLAPTDDEEDASQEEGAADGQGGPARGIVEGAPDGDES